jgi:methionyl-tRNA synthetase
VGKQIVVVANLKPSKLMGVESRGMLLAATGADGKLVLVTPERSAEIGSKVK